MINASQIKSLGKPFIYRFQDNETIEFISPVELKSGGFSFYVQSYTLESFHCPPEEFAGPFETCLRRFRYMQKFEADLIAEMAA